MANYKLEEFQRGNNTFSYGGGGSDVSVTPHVQSGTKIATISIDEDDTDIWAPNVTVDSSLSSTSENPVQNKVIKSALDDKANQATTYTKTETDNAIAAAAFIPTSAKGAASGVAELDSNGKVPSAQLPSYVDDVIEGYYDSITDRFYEESSFTTVIPPEDSKSWVDIASNKSYRWSGSVYVRVDEGVQLGTTHGSAAYGDEGLTAYQHSQIVSGNPHGTNLDSLSNVSIDNNITDGQVLKYSNGTWVNGSGGSTVTSMTDLSDTSITSPSNGQILKYNNGVWVNDNESGGTTVIANPQGTATGTLSSLQVDNNIYSVENGTDDYEDLNNKPSVDGITLEGDMELADFSLKKMITITQAEFDELDPEEQADPDIIYYISDASPTPQVIALENLSNVNIDNPSPNQFLKYDDENEQWINGDINLEGVQTVTGNPITLTDGSETYADELSVDLEPIQSGSGTPSPSNIRPITGYTEVAVDRCGKNLVFQTITGASISSSGKVVSNSVIDLQVARVEQGVTYTATEDRTPANNFTAGFFTDIPVVGSVTYNGGRYSTTNPTFIAPITGYVAFWTNTGYSTPMLERGNQKTTYEPYNGISLTVPLGQTVYGATVDVANGVMVVDRVYREFTANDSITWILLSESANIFFCVWTKNSTLTSTGNDGECSSYSVVRKLVSDLLNGEILLNSNTISVAYSSACVKDTRFTTAADFKASLTTPLQICYELATPITYRLTPAQLKLLKGKNYISSNGTTIYLTYQPDNAVGDAVAEAEKYADRIKLNPTTILDDVAVSGSSTQYTIPDISQYTMMQFVLTTCPASGVAYIRDTKTIPVSVLLHNIATYTYNHIITLLAIDPSSTDKWTECRIEMNSTTQIFVRSESGASSNESPRLSIIAW